MAETCTHIDQAQTVTQKSEGCEDCLLAGDKWVHLRLCLTCGHVGCCDDSKNKHASAHFQLTAHPVIESLEPEENWRWCFVDQNLAPIVEGQLEEPPKESEPVKTLAASAAAGGTSTAGRNDIAEAHLPNSVRALKSHTPGDRGPGMFKSVCQRVRRCNKKNLEPTIELAVEIAREGREGRRIGTLFTFGDADAVLARSRPLILDPLIGHSDSDRRITEPNLRGTIKELAQLDGAFIVSDEGIVVSACRYLDAMASDVVLPYGMASRHLAGASISQVTDAIAIVVSESSMVRVFDDGKLVAEIIPELWLMDHYNVQIRAPYDEERVGNLAVLTSKD